MKIKHLLGLCLAMLLAPQISFSQTESTELQVQKDSVNTVIEQARQGNARAQNLVGSWYYSGNNLEQDYYQALQWWARSAQQNNINAIGNMALCYQYGRGIEKDSVMATQLYLKSIERGNQALLTERKAHADKGDDAFNSVLVALCYQKGIGINQDKTAFYKYITAAANLNSVDAQRELAIALEEDKELEHAASWFKRAAEQGDLLAIHNYGRMLLNGIGVKQDKQQAIIYWLKAAEAGHAQTQCDLGNLYYKGKDITPNKEQAAHWFKKSAEQNFQHAQWNLAICYMNGEGVNRDFDQAIYWFAEASDNGYANTFKQLCNDADKGWKGKPFGDYLAGMNYYYGEQKDIEQAVKIFKAVGKKKIAEAYTMLGLCYANKDWKKQNIKNAVKEFKSAVKAGSSSGQFYLATLYETGKGVDVDMAQALALYHQAAEAGMPMAQSYLGDIYYEGRGVEQSYETAVKYYKLAEEQTQLSSNAAKRYASCYENGWGGLDVDMEKAKSLLTPKKNNTKALLKLLQ